MKSFSALNLPVTTSAIILEAISVVPDFKEKHTMLTVYGHMIF